MSDRITATATPSTFKVHDEGQFVAQCVDTIDLGKKVQDFPGTTPYLAPTCALVFLTGEKNDAGELIEVSREFTVSMGDKANLRKFLEQWRGRPYTREAIEAGVPLDKLTGNYGLITVTHRESAKGKKYANISACVGVPKQMATGLADYQNEYQRDEWWATKKQEYATAAAAFEVVSNPKAAKGAEFDDFPPNVDPDDDLPF